MARPKFKPRPKKPTTGQHENKRDLAARIAKRLACVKESNEPVDRSEAIATEIKLRAAVDDLMQGKCCTEQLMLMSREIGLTMVMCHSNFAQSAEYEPLAIEARDALKSIGDRFIRTGKWGVSGHELRALRDVIDLRAELLAHEKNTKGIESQFCVHLAAEIDKGNVIRFTEVREGVAA